MTTAAQAFVLSNNVPWKRSYELLRNGSFLPLAGASLRMQFRPKADSDEVAIDLSTANGKLIIVDAAKGIWAFNVSTIDALQVSAGSYVHDMIVTLASGEAFLAFTGSAVVTQGVTRIVPQWQ